jgi:hypothetical protein
MVLRTLGEEAAPAVEALLELRSVNSTRLGWELWEAIVEGDGLDPEPFLIEAIDLETIDFARAAIWDEVTIDPEMEPHLRLVQD